MNVKSDKENGQLVLELYLKIEKGVDPMESVCGLQEIDGVIGLENAK